MENKNQSKVDFLKPYSGRLKTSKRIVSLLTILFVLFWSIYPGFVYQSKPAKADTIAWWDNAYGYRQQLTITNNSASTLPTGYSVTYTLLHSALVTANKSLASGNDVRIVYWNGAANVELDRVNEGTWNSYSYLWFKTQAAIDTGTEDNNYFLYYDNQYAGSPPASRSNVYEFYDDFSTHSLGALNNSNWTVQSGNWSIENDTRADGSTGKVLSLDSTTATYNYAYINVADYDNVLVETKMKLKSGDTGIYWPFGARLNSTTGANYSSWTYSTTTKVNEFTTWTSSATQRGDTGGTGAPGNTWHTVKFGLENANFAVWYDNYKYIPNSGTYNTFSPYNLTTGKVFAVDFQNNQLQYDSFKIRKFVFDEPTLVASAEELGPYKPTVTLAKAWRFKGDGYTATDQTVVLNINFANAPEASTATYSVVGQSMTGTVTKINSTTWQEAINITKLPVGGYTLATTVSSGGVNYYDEYLYFYITVPFYHVWTIDWEGLDYYTDHLSDLYYLNIKANNVDGQGTPTPLVHFFNPVIYNWYSQTATDYMENWVKTRRNAYGDEIGLHLHMFSDLVTAAGVTPLSSPHCAGGTWDGYDIPTYAYSDNSQTDAETILTYAKNQFSAHSLGTPTSFRAGGWAARLSTIKALQNTGFQVDASGRTEGPLWGTCNIGWAISEFQQPYYPCDNDINTNSCSGGGTNMSIWEMADSLGNTAGDGVSADLFANYYSAPTGTIQVGVLLSHANSYSTAGNDETDNINGYFNYIKDYLYATDKGAVKFVTLQNVAQSYVSNSPTNPSSLNLADGSWTNDNTPTLTFTQSDPDAVDIEKFRIQIDDTVGFGSPVVDYTSVLQDQGATSFTVGQAAGLGTYTTGNEGQTLATGTYYWRVMSTDNRDLTSSWATANGGAVAFGVDTTAPTPNPSTGSATADSSSQITWTISATTDATSGLASSPYSFDNGSTWQVGTTYQRTSLTPNTQYSQTLKAKDAAGNQTTAGAVSKYTLSKAPDASSVTADKSASTWYNTSTFTFTNNDGFGAGGVEYYKYAWNKNATYAWPGGESTWNSTTPTLSATATSDGSWYLHVKGYNFENADNGTYDYGPYYLDSVNPSITDDQTGDDTWHNVSGTTYDVDFSNGGSGSQLDYAQYAVGSTSGGTDIKTWTDIFTTDTDSYTTNWSVDFDALQQGTNYVSVRVYDTAGNSASSNGVFYIKKDTTSPTISSVSVSSDLTSCTVTWTTSEASTSQLDWGITTSYGNQTTLDSNSVTSHSATVSSLAAGTTYHLRARSQDIAGNLVTSSDYSCITTSLPATTISGVLVTNLSPTSVKVTWITNHAATSKVRYGLTTAYGSEVSDNTLVTGHEITITGLSAGTTYHYEVMSQGNTYVYDADATFTTQTIVVEELPYLAAPTIVYPKDGETVVEKQPWILGLARSNNTIFIVIDDKLENTVLSTNHPSDTGSFFYKLRRDLPLGTHTLYTIARNADGVYSAQSPKITFSVKTPSIAPTVLPPVEKVEERIITEMTIPGVAANDSTIKVYVDGKLFDTFQVENDSSGTANFAYNLDLSKLSVGKHTVYTVAYNQNGTPSLKSKTYSIYKNGVYVVKKGDSLWKIAKTLLGNGRLYSKIAQANKKTYPQILFNPNLIKPGWKLQIPAL